MIRLLTHALVLAVLCAPVLAEPARTVERWGVFELELPGTTSYAWIHQTRELQELTLKTLAASPFNKIRMCVFPKDYVYNQNEPELYPFVRRAEGENDYTRFDPAFWHHLEQRVLDLQALEVEWSSPSIDPQPIPAERLRHRAE